MKTFHQYLEDLRSVVGDYRGRRENPKDTRTDAAVASDAAEEFGASYDDVKDYYFQPIMDIIEEILQDIPEKSWENLTGLKDRLNDVKDSYANFTTKNPQNIESTVIFRLQQLIQSWNYGKKWFSERKNRYPEEDKVTKELSPRMDKLIKLIKGLKNTKEVFAKYGADYDLFKLIKIIRNSLLLINGGNQRPYQLLADYGYGNGLLIKDLLNNEIDPAYKDDLPAMVQIVLADNAFWKPGGNPEFIKMIKSDAVFNLMPPRIQTLIKRIREKLNK